MPERKPQGQDSTPDQTPQDDNQPQEQPKEQAPAEEAKKLDETIPGGKYKTPDGRLVNANGEPIDEQGKVIKPS